MNIHNQTEVGEWVRSLIIGNRLYLFYQSKYWRALRKEVMQEHKGECQMCKAKGFYKKAITVHHDRWVRKYPSLALSKTYIYNGKEYKNLIPVCDLCHKAAHDFNKKEKNLLTAERWD